MKKNWLLLVLGIFTIVFSACSGGGDLKSDVAELVPASSTAVVALDLKSLMGKLNMESLKEMDFYKDAIADAAREGGEVAAKVMENPESSGINLSEKAYFFADLESKRDGLFGLVFSVADAQKLESLILEGEGEIETKKGISYLTGAGDFTIAWKGKVGFMGTVLNNNNEDFQTRVFNVFNNNKNSIADNAKAVKGLSQNGDITYYFKTDVLTKVFKDELAMSELFLTPEYLKDNHFWGSTNFEKGKVESTSEANLSKELNADLKMIFADGSATDFSRFIPKKDLMMSMTGKLNMRGINQLLKDKNLNGLLNMRLNAVGLSADDIAKAIDGDMVLAVNKTAAGREPSILFAIKIDSRKQLDEILGKGETLGMLVKEDGNTYRFGGYGSPEGQIIIQDKLMIFSNNLPLLAKLKKGKLDKSESISSDTYESMNGVLGIYVDYEAVFGMMNRFSGGAELDYNNMKEAIVKFNWGKSTSTITMKDDSKNALELMTESMNEQYLDMKKQELEWEKEWEKMEMEDLELEGLEAVEEAVEM